MFHSVEPKTLSDNVFSLIGDEWMLLTAGNGEQCNTMTASWGGLGILWGAPVATCYVRPQRYTKEFLDREEYFTLTFFGEEYRKQLALCGSKSGRDVDKFKEMKLTPIAASQVKAPMIAESPVNIECRVREIIPLGSHDMFLADVLAVHADEKYMDEKRKFHLEKAEPIVYSHGAYLSCGEQVGTFGYSVKKK